MKRIGIVAALFVMLFGCSLQSQAQLFGEKNEMKSKPVFGGNFGFGVSGNYLNLLIAPQVGYRLTNAWEVGVRGTYNLQCWFRTAYNSGSQTIHWFGPGVYTNVEIGYGIFAHAEYEGLYRVSYFNKQQTDTSTRRWYDGVFVGGGYRNYSESGGNVYFMVLYNLLYDRYINEYSPYSNPIVIRVGYCF